ncbi:MAG: hypothetical protein ACXWUG_29855, partial [Polyangiales bacterium]
MRRVLSLALVLLGCGETGGGFRPSSQCDPASCNSSVALRGSTSIPAAMLPSLVVTVCHDTTCKHGAPFGSPGTGKGGPADGLSLSFAVPIDGSLTFSQQENGYLDFVGGFRLAPGQVHDGDAWSIRIESDESSKPLVDVTVHAEYHELVPTGAACRGMCLAGDLGTVTGCDSATAACTSAAIERDESCSTPGVAKTRTCNRACEWTEWSACGEWRPMAAPPKDFVVRAGVASTWMRDRFVVLGGHDGTKPLTDGAIYDPKTDAWKAIPAAPYGKLAHSVAAIDDQTLVLYSDQGPVRLSLATDPPTWEKLPPPPLLLVVPIAEEVATAWLPATREVMFLVCPYTTGGRDALAYSVDAGTWRELPRLGKERASCEPVPLDGGVGFTGVTGFFSIFDEAAEGWRSSSLPTSVLAFTRGEPVFAVSSKSTSPPQAWRFDP